MTKSQIETIHSAPLIQGFTLTQSASSMIKTGIADALYSQSLSLTQLAKETQLSLKNLARFLRLLKLQNLVQKTGAYYTLTPSSAPLARKHPESITYSTLMHEHILYLSWQELPYCLQDHRLGFEKKFNSPLYEYLKKTPEQLEIFKGWMKESHRDWIIPILNQFNFNHFNTIIDIGGSEGHLCQHLLHQYPQLKATLIDDPMVLKTVKNPYPNRLFLSPGSIFEPPPIQGDIYILSRVLLNWSDEMALKILNSIYSQMPPSSQLLIIDFINDDSNPQSMSPLVDINLMVLFGTQTRSLGEFSRLLTQSQFQVSEVLTHPSTVSLIVATPN